MLYTIYDKEFMTARLTQEYFWNYPTHKFKPRVRVSKMKDEDFIKYSEIVNALLKLANQ